ncbi:4968_t:CDS:2, partial [Cetraspora pellucida]
MPKITFKRLDPSKPNESLVEQQVHVISNERLKEIKSWIDSTKHYSLSG